jgi:hypothetical protein
MLRWRTCRTVSRGSSRSGSGAGPTFSRAAAVPPCLLWVQTRRFRDVRGMSGLPQTADISGPCRRFAFVPQPDSCTAGICDTSRLDGCAAAGGRVGKADKGDAGDGGDGVSSQTSRRRFGGSAAPIGHPPLCTLSERSPFSRSVSFRSLGWLLEARLANESKRAGKSEDH